MIKDLTVLLLCFLFFTSCSVFQTSSKSDNDIKYNLRFERLRDSALLPQWFFSPSPGNTIGSLGMARTISVSGNPEYHARKYALNGLLDYFGITPHENEKNYKELLKGEKKEAYIGGRLFSIPDILKSSDYIVARAVYGNSSAQKKIKEISDFSPYDCRPFWICSPSSGDIGGILGVSYRAASPQRQYEIAVENGLILLKYSHGIDVKGTEEINRLRSGTGMIRIRKNNFSLKMLGNTDKIKLYVKEVRFVGETMFLRLVSPDLPSYKADNSWLEGVIKKGAVGESGKTAANLLSAQIESAAEKAVTNMAMNKELGIEVFELIKRSTYSSLFDQIIKSSVNTTVFPALRGFYLDREDRVKVWMVPAGGSG
jgi:hypothetical protein